MNISINSASCSTAGLKTAHTLSAAESASAGAPAGSERIVFASFSGVYDTFSLFQWRIRQRGSPCEVRTYRFCPFFPCLRYVFTFPAANPPARSPLRGQNVSFLPVFSVFTIRSHFSSSGIRQRGGSCTMWKV